MLCVGPKIRSESAAHCSVRVLIVVSGSGRVPLISPRHIAGSYTQRHAISHSLNQYAADGGASGGGGGGGGGVISSSPPGDGSQTVPNHSNAVNRRSPTKKLRSANPIISLRAGGGGGGGADSAAAGAVGSGSGSGSSPPSPVKFGRPSRPISAAASHSQSTTAGAGAGKSTQSTAAPGAAADTARKSNTRALAAAIGISTPPTAGSYIPHSQQPAHIAPGTSYSGDESLYISMLPAPVAVSSLPSTFSPLRRAAVATGSPAPPQAVANSNRGGPEPFISVGARPRVAPGSGGSAGSTHSNRVRRVRAGSAATGGGDDSDAGVGVEAGANSGYGGVGSFDPDSAAPEILIGEGEVPSSFQYNSDSDAHARASAARDKRLIDSYFVGQIANVTKMGVWWAVFGPLTLAMFRGSVWGVACARLVFNSAMLMASPIAGAAVERISARSLLVGATIARGLLYSIVIPLAWLFMRSDWIAGAPAVASPVWYGVFLTLLFADGACVAFANVVDCDCGGLELVAAQYATAPIADATRRRLTTTHESAFDLGMIILTPCVAGAGLALDRFFESVSSVDSAVHGSAGSVGAIVFILGAVFLVTSVVSALSYSCGLPELPPPPPDAIPAFSQRLSEMYGSLWAGFGMCWSRDLYQKQRELDSAYTPLTSVEASGAAAAAAAASNAPLARGSVSSSGASSRTTGTHTPASGGLVVSNDSPPHVVGGGGGSALTNRALAARSALRWRLFFLALETSFEDAVISVVIAVYAITSYTDNSSGMSDSHSYSKGLLLAACIIAIGKIGGVISSRLVHRHWTPPSVSAPAAGSRVAAPVVPAGSLDSAFRPLFIYVFVGGVCTLLFPLAAVLRDRGGFTAVPYLIVGLASFCYFLFSTGPKSGFATLIQSLAVESDATGPMFTFIAAFLVRAWFARAYSLQLGSNLDCFSLVFRRLSILSYCWSSRG